MKTVRIDMIDKEMPMPSGNPVLLHAAEDLNMVFGDIRHVQTGIRFYLPSDTHQVFHPKVQGLMILGSYQVEPSGDLVLVVMCSIMSIRLNRLNPVADMNLFDMQLSAVRFAMFNEGRRLMFGIGEKVENRTDISDTKP